MRFLLLVLTLSACSFKAISPVSTASANAQFSQTAMSDEVTSEQKAMALHFDRFLKKDLSSLEWKYTKELCQKDPSQNPFCFGYLNKEELEDRWKKYRAPEPSPKAPRVTLRWKGKELSNWDEVRKGAPTRLVKLISRYSASRLKLLAEKSLQEPQCPNSMAIAVAAVMEDDLPNEVEPGLIASLYEKGGDCQTDPDDRENALTRAGLFYYWKNDFAKAFPLLKKSASVTEAKSPRPWYWMYRSAIELKDSSSASEAIRELKKRFPFSLHTILARLASGENPDDILERSDPTVLTRTKQAPELNPMIESAELLARCGYFSAAAKVSDWVAAAPNSLEPEFRIYLTQLRGEEGIANGIYILSKVLIDYPELVSKKTLTLFYPKAFISLFEKNVTGTDPYLLLAIARQESAFNPKAVSSARAKGLLQVVRGKNLLDPETNVKAGSRMFSLFYRRADGQLPVALAAYNAGPKRPEEWARRYQSVSPLLFMDLIPFKETRSYPALILRNYYWYRKLYSPSPAKLPWLSENEDIAKFY